MTPRAVLALAALHAALAAAILLAGMAAGRAAPVGWRIAIEACRGGACRPLPGSAQRWGGLFACQGRAETIAAAADLTHLLPAGTRVRARCRPVDGMPGA